MRTSENSQKPQKAPPQPIKLKEKIIPAIPQETQDAIESSQVEEECKDIMQDEDLNEVHGKVQESTEVYSNATDIEPSEVTIYCNPFHIV